MKNKKILIVEDEPIIALDYKIFLEQRGYYTIVSYTGKNAIDKIKVNKPDLVLLDIRLKDGASGLKVGELLQSLNIPFIFISAFSDSSNYKKALHLKPKHIFQKPVNFNAVYTIVEKILFEN